MSDPPQQPGREMSQESFDRENSAFLANQFQTMRMDSAPTDSDEEEIFRRAGAPPQRRQSIPRSHQENIRNPLSPRAQASRAAESLVYQPQGPEPTTQTRGSTNRPQPAVRGFNYLKTRVEFYVRKAVSFYDDSEDPKDSLEQTDRLKETLTELLPQWVSAVESTTDAEPELANECVEIEDKVRRSLSYLKRLRIFIVNNINGTTESTFANSRVAPRAAAAEPNQNPPVGPSAQVPPPQQNPENGGRPWRTSTQIDDQVRGGLSAEQAPFSETPHISHIAQMPPPEQTPSLGDPNNSPPGPSSATPRPGAPERIKENSSSVEDPKNYLPKLSKNFKLPRFNGDAKGYRKFMDMFDTFVHERNIPDLQKVLLLHEALGGKAYNSVKHLSVRAENYLPMKQLLERLFGQKSMAEDSHLRELDRILSTGGDIRPDKLPTFVNSISQHILALISIGHTYATLTAAFANRILARLSFATQHKFMDMFRTSTNTECKLEALLSFLETEAITFEALRVNQSNRSSYAESSSRPGRDQAPRTHFNRPQPPRPQSYGNRHRNYPENSSYKNTSNNFHITASTARTPFRPTAPTPQRSQVTPCVFCEADHPSFKCTAQLTLQERLERVKSAGACMRCLKLNHLAKNCREGPKVNCRYCNFKHYAILCSKAPINTNTQATKNTSVNIATETGRDPTFLWTAHVKAESRTSTKICRILIDPGSESSLITAAMAHTLGSTPTEHVNMAMSTAGGQITNIYNCGVHEITLRSRFDPRKSLRVRAIELNCISRTKFPIMRETFGLTPAADQIGRDESEWVDVLLGVKNLANIGFSNPKTFDNIFAFETIFGWIFGGSEGATKSEIHLPRFCGFIAAQPSTSIVCNDTATSPQIPPSKAESPSAVRENTMEDIECLWRSEALGLEDEASSEIKEEEDNLNKALIEHLVKTTQRDSSGRYILRLPFRDNLRALGDNENLSRSRLHSFLNKLRADPTKLKAVDDEIKGYIDAGFAEEAQPKTNQQLAHYLPIQAVFKANPEAPSGLKTRIVKDASARRSNEAGLNDVLHQGPNLLPNILKVIFKFRQYRYVITADIEKAFLQFRIAEEDRTFLRFLWPLGISGNENARIKEFWATRLDFGLVCSPFLHCQGLRLHLQHTQELHPRDRIFIQEIIDNFYMDDIPAGSNDIQDAKHRIQLLFEIFQEAHMPLKKWSTNSSELAEFINHHSPIENPTVSHGLENSKFLGVPWNQVSDTLSVPTSKAISELQSGEPSKRKLLRGLAQIFDPLGIAGPTTINSKILLQKLWKSKQGWDTPLDEAYKIEYAEFITRLSQGQTSIKRLMLTPDNRIQRRELHAFADASLTAYGCVIYLREIFDNAIPRVHFLIAKGKVSPVRPMSIHRLELLGALLSARLVNTLTNLVDLKIDSTHLYSDNSSVLGWVKSSPERWKPYVANRIRRIHALVGQVEWSYVQSEHNPADLVSRGADISDNPNKNLWLKGPIWLSHRDQIPTQLPPNSKIGDVSSKEFDAERRQNVACMVTSATRHIQEESIFFEKTFSSWIKAIRFWALMQRLSKKAQQAKSRVAQGIKSQQHPRTNEKLTFDAEEMIEARLSLLQLIQKTYFKEEYENQCSNVKKSHQLYLYNPYLEEDGLIHCRSRLTRSSHFSESQKNPIILPGNCNLSRLIVQDIHERQCFHSGGMNAVLQILRQDFLLIHARKIVRQVINSCATCRLFHGEAASLPTPPLPSFRLEEAPPFTNTGCDFAGPFRYKKDSGEVGKCYILLLTCSVSRAVHLELTYDLSTVEVLGALQKFINRFPSVRTITSDNGLSFQRAAKELRVLYEHIRSDEVKKFLANTFIKWKFITPSAPWFGAFYERQVQTIKRPLRKILGTAIPHFRDFEIILSGIEAMVNSRPITTVASGADEIEALTPADLLFGYRGGTFLPEHKAKPQKRIDQDKIIFSTRWKYQQRLLSAYWKRYHEEYLQYLKTAHKQTPARARPLAVGEICLLQGETFNRALWPLCRVIGFPENTDPKTARSCIIRTSTGQVLNRPIKKLYPIDPITDPNHDIPKAQTSPTAPP
ncbi:uncharacterized protein LOC100904758 [Galendromus occidentalis]|uniref:Uncharacterized protein LOC100904758 n=1 Tax=Galendromus occidentalis TaxID=34638 RepID=A0AAJ6QTC3_9ACAR|nr:uncharacterized protein LOC100904758 [Galendromus occidentalis]